jgi:hypothetical protein
MVISFGEAMTVLTPLYLFVIGMVVYSVFIFKFYQFIAKRDLISLNLEQYSESNWAWLQTFLRVVLYIIEYIILFPIFISVWFGIFAALIMVLSKDQSTSIILLIAMAIVSAVRVTSYYNEDLSKDLAKMLPLALLGVFLIDINFITFDTIVSRVGDMPSLLSTVLYYLIFAMSIELLLRIYVLIFGRDEISAQE